MQEAQNKPIEAQEAVTPADTNNGVSTKDVIITFKVTPEEKKLLIQKAVVEAGITLTDFIKYKVFTVAPVVTTTNASPEVEVISDEEKEMLEALVRRKDETILRLTNEITTLKAGSVDLTDKPTELAEKLPDNFIEMDSDITEIYEYFNERGLFKLKGVGFGLRAASLQEIKKVTQTEFVKACSMYVKHRTESNMFTYQTVDDFFIDYFAKVAQASEVNEPVQEPEKK
jgi:uncharacterized protein (DUF1778 family)